MSTNNCGKIRCPICQGSGKVTEDAQEYVFETRDPRTNVCLICGGSGKIHNRVKLPDGVPAGAHAKATSAMSAWEKRVVQQPPTPRPVKQYARSAPATPKRELAPRETDAIFDPKYSAGQRPIYVIVVSAASDIQAIIQSIEGV